MIARLTVTSVVQDRIDITRFGDKEPREALGDVSVVMSDGKNTLTVRVWNGVPPKLGDEYDINIGSIAAYDDGSGWARPLTTTPNPSNRVMSGGKPWPFKRSR